MFRELRCRTYSADILNLGPTEVQTRSSLVYKTVVMQTPCHSPFLFCFPTRWTRSIAKKPCFLCRIYFCTICGWQSTATKIVNFAIASKQNYKRLTFSKTRIKRLCHLPKLSRRGPPRPARRRRPWVEGWKAGVSAPVGKTSRWVRQVRFAR